MTCRIGMTADVPARVQRLKAARHVPDNRNPPSARASDLPQEGWPILAWKPRYYADGEFAGLFGAEG